MRWIIAISLALLFVLIFWLYCSDAQVSKLDDLVEIRGNSIYTKQEITITLPMITIPIPKGTRIATVEE